MLSIYLPQLTQETDLPDICSYPVFSDQFTAIISHREPLASIYIHNKAHEQQIQNLLDDLYDAYTDKGKTTHPHQFFSNGILMQHFLFRHNLSGTEVKLHMHCIFIGRWKLLSMSH